MSERRGESSKPHITKKKEGNEEQLENPGLTSAPSQASTSASPAAVLVIPPAASPQITTCCIGRIGAGVTNDQHVKITSVASKPSFVNTPVPPIASDGIAQTSTLESVVNAVDPTTGLAPENR